MIDPRFLRLASGEAAPVSELPELPFDRFASSVAAAVEDGARLVAHFGSPRPNGPLSIVSVLDPGDGALALLSGVAGGESVPSLTPRCPQAHLFEREIAEQWGVQPDGHPWNKPVRFHPAWRRGAPSRPRDGEAAPWPAPSVMEFFTVEGEEVHEVAVGPVHAGVIEPGHFRFQCYGEEVLHLEISLGYQHRGIERALLGGPDKRTIPMIETIAGDTTIGHALAHCQLLEGLSHASVPPRALAIRGIALELERVANHVGDLGALAGDVGFQPTAAFCGRIRGEFLNLTARICGSRFGRGLVRPGGVLFDLSAEEIERIRTLLVKNTRDAAEATALLWETPSVTARMEATGPLTREQGERIGLVGPAARACGLERDVRKDHPTGIFPYAQIPTATWETGDVFARAYVRELEISRSLAFVSEQLQSLPAGPTRATVAPLAPESIAVSLVEGWRGEICHVGMTDAQGRIARYKIVDPSFHNWFGLALAMRGQPISDFPLCNKSFNLSYCGHDL